jgi:hypothetical protein
MSNTKSSDLVQSIDLGLSYACIRDSNTQQLSSSRRVEETRDSELSRKKNRELAYE